jgi:glycosyltransferase involved in cell wall biosynthesis
MISIVYCTKEHKPEHIEHLKKACGNPKVEIIEYINNGEGLTKYYQKGLKEAKNDIIVFCHDDITIETKQIARKLVKLYDKNPEYGILGVAGTKYMSETGRWWDDRKKMYGRVAHTANGRTWLSAYSDDIGNNVTETIIVDGVFFSVHRQRIKEDFDLDVKGFHFYEIDFCFRNYLKGVKVGVHTNIRVNHQSVGATNDEWEENRKTFADKFKEDLPVKIDREFTGKEVFNVLVTGKTIGDTLGLVDKLKKAKHNVTVCTPVNDADESNFRKLVLKGVKFVPLSQPPGYKIGDGEWGMQTPNGLVKSEVNKMYRIGEVKFNLTHTTDTEMSEHMKKIYPELPCVTVDGNMEEITNVYQTVLA